MASLLRTEAAVGATDNTLLSSERLRSNSQGCENIDSADGDKKKDPVTLEYIMKVMTLQFTKTRQLLDTVRDEINAVYVKIDAVVAEVKADIESVKSECTAKFHLQDAALNSFAEKVVGVSQKIGALASRNELVISGIPSKPNENLNLIVKKIGRHLAVKDKITDMTETRRLRTDGPIVVEFALNTSRNTFYSEYLRKRDLKLEHVGLDSPHRVYINESLTVEARKLKSAALNLKKAGKLASVYTADGVVRVKPSADGPSIAVNTEDELEKIRKY